MRERTRLEHETEQLSSSLSATEWEAAPGGGAAWPPRHLKWRLVLRHWLSLGVGFEQKGGPVLLTADEVDPRFAPMPNTGTCLAAWKASPATSAKQSLVAVVDLSQSEPRYLGTKDTEPVNLVSAAKLAVMYPAFQLRRDLRVLAERDRPADGRTLFEAMRKQWTSDLVDAGPLGTDRRGVRRWVDQNGPMLERIVALDPSKTVRLGSHPVSFTSDFSGAVEAMILHSDNEARQRCIDLMKPTYIASVLLQSGKLAALKPLAWTGTMQALATMLTLIARRKLVSYYDSLDMWRLLHRGATSGAGTWTRYALNGHDDRSDASRRRPHESVAGKIGYLYGGPQATWWDNITTMADASLVAKIGGKSYVLCFAIPFHKRVIRQKDVFPLIRAVHDCI